MFKNHHFILLSLYPVLFLYSSNLDMAAFSTAAAPMLLMAAAGIFFYFILNLFFKSPVKSSLVVSLLAVLFFSYGHVHSFIYSFFLEYEIDLGTKHRWRFFIFKESTLWLLFVSYVIVLVWVWIKITKTKNDILNKISKSLNFVSLLLIIFPLITISFSAFAGHKSDKQSDKPMTGDINTPGTILDYKPDIYYIILDGYARKDVFADYYKFDNSSFLRKLEDKGFTISSKARVSYNQTCLSLSSTLNMKYVNFLAEELGVKSTSFRKVYSLVRNNSVTKYLKTRGYRFVHFNSTWAPAMENPAADVEIGCADGLFQVEFYRVLAESSLFKLWESPVGTDLASCHLFNFRKLETIATLKGPKFVFAHIVPPHHPYLFDREGNILRNATVSNQFEFQKKLWGDKKKYIDQVEYISKRAAAFIDSILTKSAYPPIILIQSDHGPHLLDKSLEDHKDFLHGRFAILSAVYLPDGADIIPEGMVSLNLFRRVFNHYFKDTFPILEKSHYYSDYKSPYHFIPVSFDD